MLFTDTLPKLLPAFHFTWNPLVGAYRCVDAQGHVHETTLTACDCLASVRFGSPCSHSLQLLAQAEDGALLDGPASVAGEVDRQRAVREALMEELLNRAWEMALEDPEPGERCLFCGGRCFGPLVEGWATICSTCLCEGEMD